MSGEVSPPLPPRAAADWAPVFAGGIFNTATQWIEDFQLKISSGHFFAERWYLTPQRLPVVAEKFAFFFFKYATGSLAGLSSNTEFYTEKTVLN